MLVPCSRGGWQRERKKNVINGRWRERKAGVCGKGKEGRKNKMKPREP